MTETRVSYVVQCWHADYEYWGDVVEQPKTMFGPLVTGYETPEEALGREAELHNTELAVRTIRRTVTEETI